jgi:hypothetical protein
MTNQEAFDTAVLHLLNQAYGCVSSSGKSQYRGTNGGKNAIGALIPDELYSSSMEGKTIHQILAVTTSGYEPLREHLRGVSPRLLTELQDLHDRVGKCLPSLFRDIVLDGCPRVAQMFSLSLRMIQLWAVYRKIPGPLMRDRSKAVPPPPVVVLAPPRPMPQPQPEVSPVPLPSPVPSPMHSVFSSGSTSTDKRDNSLRSQQLAALRDLFI